MHPTVFRAAAAATLLATAGAACAQSAPASTTTLKEVTVTGNPLSDDDVTTPVQSYSGTGLLLRSQSTLGETLGGTPGVSSTYFGPTASRPVIRGLDGDRIRILSNSGTSLDVSNLSYDHAVAADPITIERLEVLRGPGALLYGGNAIGGVVNLIDNRIPREPVQGVSGRANAGYATGSRETSGAAVVEGGNGRLGLHVDAFSRRSDEVAVPLALACTQGGLTRVRERICNSAAQSRGGAVGGAVSLDHGYVGASVGTYDSAYGAVAEDEATIRMRSTRTGLEGEWRDLAGPLQSLKAQASHTEYRHTEYDAGVPRTVFRNVGSDLRLQARHAPLGGLHGVVGLQAERTRFSADGEEAFAPYSRTAQAAWFAYEHWDQPWGKLTGGLRGERVTVESLGHPTLERFAAARRSFGPASASLAAQWNLTSEWQATATLARSQRAPKDYELFANGPHLATGAYELGNASLATERSTSADLGVLWRRGADRAEVRGYSTRFANYVALLATGASRSVDGDALPELAYTAVRAKFEGLEANGVRRLATTPATLDLEWRADVVRATNLDSGEPLPRIAPMRAGATLAWSRDGWGGRIGFDSYARQDRVPAAELPTAGYTLWNAAVTYRTSAAPATLLWYARLDNATDKLAQSATSILTQTAPGRVPLPGRSLKLGVQAVF